MLADVDGAQSRYRLLETTRMYALEQLAAAGETQAVQRSRDLVVGTPAAVVLEEVLFAAGYHEAHEGRYATGYSVRSSQIFQVTEGFPRLVEADCPPGLGDVHYSLELGALTAFEVHRPFVTSLLVASNDE